MSCSCSYLEDVTELMDAFNLVRIYKSYYPKISHLCFAVTQIFVCTMEERNHLLLQWSWQTPLPQTLDWGWYVAISHQLCSTPFSGTLFMSGVDALANVTVQINDNRYDDIWLDLVHIQRRHARPLRFRPRCTEQTCEWRRHSCSLLKRWRSACAAQSESVNGGKF